MHWYDLKQSSPIQKKQNKKNQTNIKINRSQQHHQKKKERKQTRISAFSPVESFDSNAVREQSYYLEISKILISINKTASALFKFWQVIDEPCLQDIWWRLTANDCPTKKTKTKHNFTIKKN